jgi:hypothetical protein
MLVHDLHIRVINAATGELLRELTLDPSRKSTSASRIRNQRRLHWTLEPGR